jgi:hypothetical protein
MYAIVLKSEENIGDDEEGEMLWHTRIDEVIGPFATYESAKEYLNANGITSFTVIKMTDPCKP